DGIFALNKKTVLIARSDSDRDIAKLLNDYLGETYSVKLRIVTAAKSTSSAIDLTNMPGISMVPGQYFVDVHPVRVYLTSLDEESRFYGLQTLFQLISKDEKGGLTIPVVTIRDQPRFPYRGMHLDVSRHFFPVEFVKKYIDLMAQYKFNYFHWHLTDD